MLFHSIIRTFLIVIITNLEVSLLKTMLVRNSRKQNPVNFGLEDKDN